MSEHLFLRSHFHPCFTNFALPPFWGSSFVESLLARTGLVPKFLMGNPPQPLCPSNTPTPPCRTVPSADVPLCPSAFVRIFSQFFFLLTSTPPPTPPKTVDSMVLARVLWRVDMVSWLPFSPPGFYPSCPYPIPLSFAFFPPRKELYLDDLKCTPPFFGSSSRL